MLISTNTAEIPRVKEAAVPAEQKFSKSLSPWALKFQFYLLYDVEGYYI